MITQQNIDDILEQFDKVKDQFEDVNKALELVLYAMHSAQIAMETDEYFNTCYCYECHGCNKDECGDCENDYKDMK